MSKLLNDFVSNYLSDERETPKRFLADKVVAFLSYLTLSFIVIDSFITLLPIGPSQIVCLVNNTLQQAFANAYCSEKVPFKLNLLPLGIFGQAIVITLLHHGWYSTVSYIKGLYGCKDGKKKPRFFLYTLYVFKNMIQIIVAGVGTSLVIAYEAQTKISISRVFSCSHEALGNQTLNCVFSSTALSNVFLVFYGFLSGLVVLAAFVGLIAIGARSDLYNYEPDGSEESCFKSLKNTFCCWSRCCMVFWCCMPLCCFNWYAPPAISVPDDEGCICCLGCHSKTPNDYAIIKFCFPERPLEKKKVILINEHDLEAGES